MQTIHIEVKDDCVPNVLQVLDALKDNLVETVTLDSEYSDKKYLQALSTTLDEWSSKEDEKAFNDL